MAQDFVTILQAEKSGSSSPVQLNDGTLVAATTVFLEEDPRIQISKSQDAGEHWRPVVSDEKDYGIDHHSFLHQFSADTFRDGNGV